MPRVTEEHLERRRQQILDAARACFIRKGFYATSMQDVFRESGLSAGAVYRYFKRKDEIVRAIATEGQEALAGFLSEILKEDPLPSLAEILGRFGDFVIEHTGPMGFLRVAPHAWAAAMHDPEITSVMEMLIKGIRGWVVKIVARLRDEGQLPPDTDVAAAAATLSCLMPGFILQRLLLGDIDGETLRTGLGALVAEPEAAPSNPAR
jgi:AcrR family transcriptional regulator